ncbi:MAG: transglycosylase [Leptospiraceae bacterium]|nr:MAG: transglycosylase [Leptospiraceae bacterium]
MILISFYSLYAIDSELLYYFRSSQWKSIINFFKKQTPINKEHNFIFAKALELEKENNKNIDYKEIIKLYLLSSGIECTNQIISCLYSYKNVDGIISNFSLLKAHNIAKENNDIELQLAILLKGDYNQNDIITKTLFRELIQYTFNYYQKISENYISYIFYLIDHKKNLLTPLSSYYIAKLYKNKNLYNKAFEYYFYAALNTQAEWLLKAIAQDIKENLNQLPYQYYRDLTAFYFDKEIIEKLKKFSYFQIIQTTNVNRIYYDGRYFIEEREWDYLYQLANRGYSFLSQNPDILESWLKQCYEDKQYDFIYKIIKIFQHVKFYNENIWKIYINSIEKLSQNNNDYKEIFFYEILEYLNYFHYDIEAYDYLMNFLIIQNDPENTEKYQYANKKFWDEAFKKMPHQTESGRFFYWLYRYYKFYLKNYELSEMIKENFYYFAPGSYYIQTIWDEIKKDTKYQDYKSDWDKVNSLVEYYRWIVKYGYNDQALYFLSSKKLNYFYNAKAVQLQDFLLENEINIPSEIIFLFRYGEYQLGLEMFKEYYKERLTKIDYYKYLVIAGQRSESPFIEVYFLRQLLRILNIPEDPFTLPPYLLKRLYPRPYREIVKKYEKEYNIHEDYIYALMRQESMFREDAISRSGAKGLMQIMPQTGKWLTSRLGIKEYNLLHPEISIQLGSKFFSDLLRMYEQDFRWASVAYNGGPGNLRKWKKKYYHGDFNYFLEILPVKESRNYCRKTYQNFIHYKISRILYDEGMRE